jgi:vesicle coat complex subunit
VNNKLVAFGAVIMSLLLKLTVYSRRQNEALLSINIFQKDLSDINPLVRAWSLRTMSGIRLHVVAPLILVAVKKCARDPSPYVRKCAAFALCKLCDLLPDESAALEEVCKLQHIVLYASTLHIICI